jgi:hypothetical protein
VTFSYNSTERYSATCVWVTGEGTKGEKTHYKDFKKKESIFGAINGDPRQTKGQNQFTGFILSGWNGEPVIEGGKIPVVGESCPGNGTDGVWTHVEQVESPDASENGLFATFGGVSHKLTITPPVVVEPVL